MRLETERLLIRPLEVADIPPLLALWADRDVTRYLGGPRDAKTVREALEQSLRESEAELGFWPLVERTSGRIVGDCGLIPKDVEGLSEVELVYVIAPDRWGRGYATEAARALRAYARERLGLPRLISLIDPDHQASIHVAAKIGMRFEKITERPGGPSRAVYAIAWAQGVPNRRAE